MFEGRIQLINRQEIPGAALYNALARAVKFADVLSPFLVMDISPAGGLLIDLDVAALRKALPGMPDMPFHLTVSDKKLAVAAGIVWLCDRRLEAAGLDDVELSGDLAVWVCFTRSQARIRTGRQFPDVLDSVSGECNLPLGMVSERADKSYSVMQRHLGDAIIMTMPHILIPGFAGDKTLVRGCVNGVERYIETAECDDEDLV